MESNYNGSRRVRGLEVWGRFGEGAFGKGLKFLGLQGFGL